MTDTARRCIVKGCTMTLKEHEFVLEKVAVAALSDAEIEALADMSEMSQLKAAEAAWEARLLCSCFRSNS